MKILTLNKFNELRNARILSMTTNSRRDKDAFLAAIFALGDQYLEMSLRKIEQLNFQHEGLNGTIYVSSTD